MAKLKLKFKFPVTGDLWDLWRRLEGEGVTDVNISTTDVSPEDNYIIVEIYDGEAWLIIPKWMHKDEEICDYLEAFIMAYTGKHTDWRREVYESYRLWLEDMSKYWLEHGMSKEEAERRKRELMEALKKDIEKEITISREIGTLTFSLFKAYRKRAKKSWRKYLEYGLFGFALALNLGLLTYKLMKEHII
jgi:thiamine pyrophosphate-dependent acetolactate synthase large subunit-like protein